MNQILNIISLLIISIIVLLMYSLLSNSNSDKLGAKYGLEFCGVVSKPEIQDEEYQLGKSKFIESCVQCHDKSLVHDATGPALGNVFIKWNKDTIQFQQYVNTGSTFPILNSERKVFYDEKQKQLNTYSHKNNFDLEQTKAIIKFLEIY